MLHHYYWETLIVYLPKCCVCLNKLFCGSWWRRWCRYLTGWYTSPNRGQVVFGLDFLLTFISSKPDGQRNAQTAVSLLTLKWALGIALIILAFLHFLLHFLGKDTPIFCHFSIFQKNGLFYMHKGPYIKYVGGRPKGYCGGHEIF